MHIHIGVIGDLSPVSSEGFCLDSAEFDSREILCWVQSLAVLHTSNIGHQSIWWPCLIIINLAFERECSCSVLPAVSKSSFSNNMFSYFHCHWQWYWRHDKTASVAQLHIISRCLFVTHEFQCQSLCLPCQSQFCIASAGGYWKGTIWYTFALFQEGTGRSCPSVPIILFENENWDHIIF